MEKKIDNGDEKWFSNKMEIHKPKFYFYPYILKPPNITPSYQVSI